MIRLAARDDRFLAVTAPAILEADERMTDCILSKSLGRALGGQKRMQLRIVEHVAALPLDESRCPGDWRRGTMLGDKTKPSAAQGSRMKLRR